MSSAFLKKSLELVECEYITNTKVIQEKGNDKVYTQLRLKNKKKKTKNHRGAADVKRKNIESVEKIRKNYRTQVDEKLIKKKLEILHRPVDQKILSKILDFIGAPAQNKKKDKSEEKSVFTEEDFASFEKEYFAD